MNAIDLLLKSTHLKRYNYFFNKKNIEAPNPSVLCRSISQQLYSLAVGGSNILAEELYRKEKDSIDDYLFDEMNFTFLFRSSPVDDIKELVPIYFSIVFWCDGFGECYHGLSIWSEPSKDFYTFMIAASAPAATNVLDYNFSSCLSQFFDQESDEKQGDTI